MSCISGRNKTYTYLICYNNNNIICDKMRRRNSREEEKNVFSTVQHSQDRENECDTHIKYDPLFVLFQKESGIRNIQYFV